MSRCKGRTPAFVYCHSIRDPKFDRPAQECTKVVKRVCPQPSNVAIVTTHWDEPGSRSYGTQMSRQKQLKRDVLKKMIEKGNEIHQTDDSPTAANDIIRSLLQNEVRVRRIREEVEEATKRLGSEDKAVKEAKGKRLIEAANQQKLSDLEAEIKILNSYEVQSKIHWNFFSSLRR
jgi:hypothetical protein